MKGLWKCAKKGDSKEFAALLSKGESLSDIDNNNRTPLHYAAEFGNIDIAKLIFARGPGIVDLEDNKGETALEIAIQNGHEELAVLLVADGGATLDEILKKAKRINIPKRLEVKLKEAEQQRQRIPIAETARLSIKEQVADRSTMTRPTTESVNSPTFSLSNQLSTMPTENSATLHRATPALPSFGRTASTAHTAAVNPERPLSQQARVASTIPVDPNVASHTPSPIPSPASSHMSANVGGNTVDLATVVLLASRVVHAGLHEQFNAALLQEMNNTVNKFAQGVPVPKDSLRVISQNLREVGQFPVLGPMDAKRSKRVKEDYVAIYERIRPLQDALRVLELDRRAHAPSLVHPPLMYLIGGVFSMFVSIEQPYTTQLDTVAASLSRSIREVAASPSPAQFGQLAGAFVHFLRCIAVRVLEIRAPSTDYEIVFLLLTMSKSVKSLLQDSNANGTQLRIVVESLRDIMVLIKSTLPSRLGKELLPAEESTLYKEAGEQFAQTIDGIHRKGSKDSSEQELVRNLASQLSKIQSGFREIHGNSNKSEHMKGGLGALGRGVLSDTQKLVADVGEVARLSAGKITSATVQRVEEWKDAKLVALETMLVIGLMVELATACIAVRNRLSHHSHVPVLLVLFAITSQFAFFPHM